jgi:hypothetical protein
MVLPLDSGVLRYGRLAAALDPARRNPSAAHAADGTAYIAAISMAIVLTPSRAHGG